MNKTQTLRKAILFVLTVLVISACNKSSQDNTPVEPIPSQNSSPNEQSKVQNCKPLKGFYYIDGSVNDSAEFVYAGDLIVRVNQASQSRYYTFEYNNGKIVKRNHFLDGATQAAAYTIFNYDTDHKIVSIEMFYDPNNKTRSYTFSYTSGKLSKVIAKRFSGGTEFTEYEYTYIYTGDNISQSTIVQFSNGYSQTSIIDYTYDNKENYFKKQPNAFLVEPSFFTQEGALYPYFFSSNNIVSILYNGAPSGTQSFVANSSGYLTEMLFNNKLAVSYKYECK
jgi:hypothetical protein